jgi:hypothetical protein
MTYTITPLRVLAVLLVYGAMFIVARSWNPGTPAAERRTALVIGLSWAVATFVMNYLLYLAGVMSFLPWLNNFMHTFVWIGGVLTTIYIGVRRRQSLASQMVMYATFSLFIKILEHTVFGTWDHPHFFHVFQGNAAYIIGWSLADGLYPPITLFGLRFVSKFIPGLVPV